MLKITFATLTCAELREGYSVLIYTGSKSKEKIERRAQREHNDKKDKAQTTGDKS